MYKCVHFYPSITFHVNDALANFLQYCIAKASTEMYIHWNTKSYKWHNEKQKLSVLGQQNGFRKVCKFLNVCLML